jgi:glycosyltransferase involved in cell wall biosynthesis
VRVLYVNHTPFVGGGERSLLELIGGLPDDIEPAAACPEGALADRLRSLGVETHPIPALDGSLKLHPLHTSRTLMRMNRAVRAVARIAQDTGADVLHGNSIRAAIVAGLAARRSGRQAVGHVRDCLPPGRVSRLALGTVERHCSAVIANSRYTADWIGATRRPAVVVHNPINLRRFDPAEVDRAAARAQLGAAQGELLLGVVAQITPWKGQDDAVRIVHGLRANGTNVRLLLVGAPKFVSKATRFDNLDFVERLHELVNELRLDEQIDFLGEREDVPTVLRALDLLLLPSWEEPFGRAVIEAMAMGTPVAATAVGGPAEILTHGRDGLLLPPRDPEAWARALAPLLADPDMRARMGRSGRERAVAAFGVDEHVARVTDVYRQLRETPGDAGAPATLAASRPLARPPLG